MLTLLASLAFLGAATAAVVSMKATWSQYRDVALGNVAALRGVAEARDYQVTVMALGRKPALAGHPGVRRLPHRAQAARPVRNAPPRRVAA